MFGRLMPREGRFFELFNEHANELLHGAHELAALISRGDDVERRAYNIESAEKRADKIAFTAIELLHRTFITPLDREDIHMLASRLDDVIDLLDGVSRRFEMLHITEATPAAKRLTGVLLRAANEIKEAVADMRKPQIVNQHVGLIKRLEEEGDAIYHDAVGALFAGKPDPIDVIKWKEMYDTLEHAIDSCMGVAQVLQSISLKNA
jgi:uncharacterized protein Yka (UPF0111/DUF47 family)